jgi:2,5-dioxopentanoate dehydrogenase
MEVSGQSLIGRLNAPSNGPSFRALNPSTGQEIDPVFRSVSASEVDQACALAEAAAVAFRNTSLEARATLLEAIAAHIEALGDALIERCLLESGLPRARLEGERGRTCGQLRLFASTVRAGEWLDIRIDPALPERKPLPRPDIRLHNIAVGPVAVFGASNFPLAFSVAGGDTASAFAAGCPVVVKAHPSHPGTSELVGRAIQAAVAQCGLPEGVFSLLFGSGNELGQALVSDARIKAVGFTGSRSGGLALLKIAQTRPQPIPAYAEMSSINPVFLLPGALHTRGQALAEGFVGSLAMGAGQFCTNPGLVVALRGPSLQHFLDQVTASIATVAPQTMLSPGIQAAYSHGSEALAAHANVRPAGQGISVNGPCQCQARVFVTAAAHFLSDEALRHEVFGSTSLVVECDDWDEVKRVARSLEGQLTATLLMNDSDLLQASELLPILEDKVGRLLVNGWPTGVEVSHAMVHGGPFPATSDVRSTSVGTAAIQRFLRPVCYQNFPQALLPETLQDTPLTQLSRLIDGQRVLPASK